MSKVFIEIENDIVTRADSDIKDLTVTIVDYDKRLATKVNGVINDNPIIEIKSNLLFTNIKEIND
jgi:hypothetical protein